MHWNLFPADIFYDPQSLDPAQVAESGAFLNGRLLQGGPGGIVRAVKEAGHLKKIGFEMIFETQPGLNDHLAGLLLLAFVVGLFLVIRFFQKKGP